VGPHEGSKPRRVMVSKEAEQLQEANQEEKAEDSPQEEQKKPE